MRILRAAILSGTTLLLVGGIVAGQDLVANEISCAQWLQWAETANRARPGESLVLPSTLEEMHQFVKRLADAYSARGIREGYATGVFATTPRGSASHIRDTEEFITALDALCAGVPQKRLIDVALHALGRR
jgi:hypothetical protein